MSETWLHEYIQLAFRIHRLVQKAYGVHLLRRIMGHQNGELKWNPSQNRKLLISCVKQ